MDRALTTITVGILLVLCTAARADLFKLGDDAVANVDAHAWNAGIPQGNFSLTPVDGKPQPGVTAEIDMEEKDGHPVIHSIRGNIWTQTAWVPFPALMNVLNATDLLNQKVFPRIFFSADAKDIESKGNGKFLIHGRVDVKNITDIPVDFEGVLTKNADGKLSLRFTSTSHADDKGIRGVNAGEVDRSRFNLGGAAWLVDKGIKLSLRGTVIAKGKDDPEEPGDLKGKMTYAEWKAAKPDAAKKSLPTLPPIPSLPGH